MSGWHYFLQHQDLLWEKLWQQIFLVIASTGLAIIIGLPAGIIIAKIPRLKHSILGLANIVQTIPSLALLAFLLPFFGIGYASAIIALMIYALLPIIRNTMLGITSVAPNLIEAARGLGFTPWQRLWHVELPLALPVLLGGIRTATVISIGIATLAAFIGAGGLGDFILQGIAVNDMRLVTLGAIPAALLALIFDFLLSRVEKVFSTRHISSATKRIMLALVIVILTASLASFIFILSNMHPTRPKNTVVIASKNFTEEYILGELMAQMISHHTHLQVIRKFNLGATNLVQAALLRGDVDMYPEYTGTALLDVLHHKVIHNENEVYRIVNHAYQKRFHLRWLSPFGFQNSQALAVTQRFSNDYNIKNISDLHAIEQQLTIGVPQEFRERADGYPGLKKAYHLTFHKVIGMEPDLMYQAIAHNNVNVILAFTTDGRIPYYHLVILHDDKHFFPPYFAAPVIRESVLKKYPQIKTALDLLAGKIDNQQMQKMNFLVTQKHLSPYKVAHQFLLAQHLIKQHQK